MTAPTIPLPVITTQSIRFTPVAKKYQYKPGETKWHHVSSKRKVPITEYTVSQYCQDLATLETFLIAQNGNQPFYWSYDQNYYTCPTYTFDYDSANRGNVTLTFVRYTGNIQ